jgi:hypothetical protein
MRLRYDSIKSLIQQSPDKSDGFCAVALNYTRKVRRDRPGDLQSIIKSFRFSIFHVLIQSGARPVVPPRRLYLLTCPENVSFTFYEIFI